MRYISNVFPTDHCIEVGSAPAVDSLLQVTMTCAADFPAAELRRVLDEALEGYNA